MRTCDSRWLEPFNPFNWLNWQGLELLPLFISILVRPELTANTMFT